MNMLVRSTRGLTRYTRGSPRRYWCVALWSCRFLRGWGASRPSTFRNSANRQECFRVACSFIHSIVCYTSPHAKAVRIAFDERAPFYGVRSILGRCCAALVSAVILAMSHRISAEIVRSPTMADILVAPLLYSRDMQHSFPSSSGYLKVLADIRRPLYWPFVRHSLAIRFLRQASLWEDPVWTQYRLDTTSHTDRVFPLVRLDNLR